MAHGMSPRSVISPHYAPPLILTGLDRYAPLTFASFLLLDDTPCFEKAVTDIFAFVASLLFVPFRSVKRNSQWLIILFRTPRSTRLHYARTLANSAPFHTENEKVRKRFWHFLFHFARAALRLHYSLNRKSQDWWWDLWQSLMPSLALRHHETFINL